MTWQLLKRDRLWWPGASMSIVLAVLIVMASVWMDLPPRVSSREVFRSDLSIFLSFETAIIILIGSGSYAWRDLYEAALPLDGRDIWLSRLFALLLVIWLPVPIGIAGGLQPLTLLAGASFTTFLSLCGKCYRIRELGTQRRVLRLILPVIFAVPTCIIFFGHALRSVHWPPASSVLAASGPASAFLFCYGWRSVPQSFSIASLNSGDSSPREAHVHPKRILFPVFRSVYTSWANVLVLVLVMGGMAKGLGVAYLAAIPMQYIPDTSRWLLALPISRRRLFAVIAAAPTVAVGVGALAAALVSHGDPETLPVRLSGFAAELASAYFAMFLLELRAWRPLSRLRLWVKWIPFVIGFFTIPLFGIGSMPSRLAQAWPLFFLLPAAAYWLAEKAFIEQEYPRPLVQTAQTNPYGSF